MTKLPRARRIGRAALLVGAAGLTLGGMLLSAGVANATVGTIPGAVQLSATSGATSGKPTWSTNVGCNAGFQGSAVFREVKADGTTASISPAVNGTQKAFSGTLQATIAAIKTLGNIPNGGTQELVVICFADQSETGNSDPEMDIAIHYSADGSTYTTDTNFGGGGSALSTTTTLAVMPNPVAVGAPVTLTATEAASDGSHPGGSVQFLAGGSALGSPVTVDSSGTAAMTTTFPAAGSVSLSATFTPTNTTGFTSSTSTPPITETVTSQGGGPSGTEPLTVTVPQSGPGSFTLTVPSGTVTMTVSGATATGTLNPIMVADTRSSSPGWSVSGQATTFAGTAAGSSISGDQLGWAPTGTSLPTVVTLGGAVAPGSPGLGTTAAVLASATAASTCTLGANLTLDIPASATPGSYSSTLTLTAVTSGP
jgi:hypothetical protein